VTVWVRRGPWGYILRPRELTVAGQLQEDAPSLTVATLSDLFTELNTNRIAGTDRRSLVRLGERTSGK
jgi:hypothetical protein